MPMDISPENDGGILKVIKREGVSTFGKPWTGDKVFVHYVGTLLDGTKFDSSRDRNEQFSFNLGKGEVIKGWDVGVASMNKGELAEFTIQAKYAYGSTGSPPKIAPDATLHFEIELFDFIGEDLSVDKNGGIYKRIKHKGEGYDSPNDGGSVTICVLGNSIQTDGAYNLFDQRDELRFTLGEGSLHNIPAGIEKAIESMKKDECAIVNLSSAYGFGISGCPQFNVLPNAKLVYEITLKSFERCKESWQLDGDEKLEAAQLLKVRGTDFFNSQNYSLAKDKYSKIEDLLDQEVSLKDEKEEDRVSLLKASRLNMAMCLLKLEEWQKCRLVCDKIIENSNTSEKAYFRRGLCYFYLNDFDLARADFLKVCQLDGTNKAAKNKIILCEREIKKLKEKEKRTFANMFDKFAAYDKKKEEIARSKLPPVEINEWKKNKFTEGLNGVNNEDIMEVKGDVDMKIDLNDTVEHNGGDH